MAVSVAERVLVDPDLDDRLRRDGMVQVPMLPPEDVAVVEKAYWALAPADEDGIRLDYLREDRALVRSLAELLTPVWERVIPEVFEHHYPVYSSFVAKYPGEDSSLYLHRDLCVDDERERATFAMWMPFVDTGPDIDNGSLAYVPGSHLIRNGGFGPTSMLPCSAYHDHLETLLEPVTVPAGTALVYDANMLHASRPNRTTRPRLAVGCLLARRDQPVIQVVATGRRHRVVHEVDGDYFLDLTPRDVAVHGMPERYPVIDEFDEEPGTSAAAVLHPAVDGDRARRAVVVPDAVRAVVDAAGALPVAEGPLPRHDHDLAIAARDLGSPPQTVAGEVTVRASGPVGVQPLVRRWRRTGPIPEAVPDAVVPLRFPTADADLVVLDPESQVELRAPAHPRRRHDVTVLEATPIAAGAGTVDGVAELDLGHRLTIAPDEPLHLWNRGPGPLVVVVRTRAGRGPGRTLSPP